MSEDLLPKKRPVGLGRGLSALLGESNTEVPVSRGSGEGRARESGGQGMPLGVQLVDVAALRAMPNQPRKNFDDAALDELAESIRSRGMLQPIIVRESTGEGHWQIIAGERRWRAAQRAQLHQVPVIVREFDDKTALELAIIENVQREELNAWEEGDAYRTLVEEHGYTQEQLGKIVGKSRSHIANLMRLQSLPPTIHAWLTGGELTMGHARALIGTDDPVAIAREVMAKGLSVRKTEALVRRLSKPARPRAPRAGDQAGNADIAALERQLSDLLGLKIAIRHEGKSGSVMLSYSSLEQLDLICQRLSGEAI